MHEGPDALARGMQVLGAGGDDEAQRMQARLAGRLFGAEPQLERIARFELRESLGSGAMGVVYAAWDPELDRLVAIKLLQDRPGQASDPESGRRLVREAKAMARLRHPNVVQVHEVGTHDGQIFVAMEMIQGCSLRAWLSERERSWREVVEVFVAAGQGLAAAHSAGLVHRDFKPDNVLIEAGGRVFVSDFGLARQSLPLDPLDELAAAELEADGELAETLTRTGACVGTPAYMAPEALRGATVDARADQFSFCASLYEALYRVRPFAGRTLTELTRAKTEGRIVAGEPAATNATPRWLQRIVLRGLAPDPAARFASIAELLAAIARGQARRRRASLGLAAGSLLGLLGLGIVVKAAELGPIPAPMCGHSEASVAAVWNPDRRDRIVAAFAAAASERPYAIDVAARSERAIDHYTLAWASMRREACEATHVHGEQSTRALDLRMRCLDRRLEELDALLTRFESPQPEDILGSLHAIDALTPIEGCAELELLESTAPLPEDPQQREAVAELRRQLDAIKAGMSTGAHVEVTPLAEQALERARAIGYKPALAEAELALGILHSRTGQPKQAVPLLEQAIVDAQASGHDEVAGEAMIAAVHVLGFQLRDIENGERHLRQGRAMLERIGEPKRLMATLTRNSGNFESARGADDLAEADFRRAVVLYSELVGPDHFVVAESLSNLAAVLRRRGRVDEALVLYRQALAALETSLGPEHPNLFNLLNNMGVAYMISGHPIEAEATFVRAIALAERSMPGKHASVGHAYNNRGELLLGQARPAEALASYDLAYAKWSGALGPDHPLVAHALVGQGHAHLALGEPALARDELERGLKIRLDSKAASPELADAEFGLARALDQLGQAPEQSLALAQQALEHLGEADGSLNTRASVVAWLLERRPNE